MIVVSASSGCLTLNPRVNLDTTGSTVFKTASASSSWGGGQVTTNVTLTPNATTNKGVTKLNVITSNRQTFYKTSLDSGESAATVMLPTNGTVTIVAVNTVNGTTVESRNATVTGDSLV